MDAHLAQKQHSFLVGSALTTADLVRCRCVQHPISCYQQSLLAYIQSFKMGLFDFIPTQYLQDYPHVVAHAALLTSLPQIASFYSAS
jgi:glutathione S-transferase